MRDHRRYAYSVWAASLLRADMIFGKDRDQTAPALQPPSYCATAKGRMTRRDDGNEGLLSLYLV